MLNSCEEDKICTKHRIVTFKQRHNEVKVTEKAVEKTPKKKLYCIPSRNPSTDKIEINTLMRNDPSFETEEMC